jgi:hypothetical protein
LINSPLVSDKERKDLTTYMKHLETVSDKL